MSDLTLADRVFSWIPMVILALVVVGLGDVVWQIMQFALGGGR